MQRSVYICFNHPKNFDLAIRRTTVVVPRRAMSRSAVRSAARSARWNGRFGQAVYLAFEYKLLLWISTVVCEIKFETLRWSRRLRKRSYLHAEWWLLLVGADDAGQMGKTIYG